MQEIKDKMNDNLIPVPTLPLANKEALEVFVSNVELYAKLHNTTTSYILDVWNNAKLLGIKDYTSAMSLFHNIDNKTSLKGKVAHALVVERGILYEPFEIIKDAEVQYYYYYGELKDILDKYVKYMLEKMQVKEQQVALETYAQTVLKLNLVTEPPRDNNGEIEKGYVKTPIPIFICQAISGQSVVNIYERITILKGKRKINGNIITRFANYKLSTAINLGLYLDKEGKIKKNWHNINRMMMRRCNDALFDALAIDANILAMFDEHSWENDDDVNQEIADDGDFSIGVITPNK